MRALAILAAAALGALGPPLSAVDVAAAAAQTFTSRVEAVRVDVLVTSGGGAVKGLTAADFEVRDNGVRQQVDLVSFEKVPLSVMLALDMSDSVSDEDLQHLRAAGGALTAALAPGDRAGLITFSHVVSVASPLSPQVMRVQTALAAARSGGHTALVDAAQAAVASSASRDARALVVIFGDGLDTASWLSAELTLQAARRSDAVVYGVVPHDAKAGGFLEDLAAATGGRLLTVSSTDRLRATFLEILEEFRHRYILSFTPRGPQKPGWHTIEVRVRSRGATVRSRPGYVAGS